MSRNSITETDYRSIENTARRMRAAAFRDSGAAVAAWVRGLFAGASAPKGGRTA